MGLMYSPVLKQKLAQTCLHVYLSGLDSSTALQIPTEKPNKNSDRKKKSDFKSDRSRDKQIYKAETSTDDKQNFD